MHRDHVTAIAQLRGAEASPQQCDAEFCLDKQGPQVGRGRDRNRLFPPAAPQHSSHEVTVVVFRLETRVQRGHVASLSTFTGGWTDVISHGPDV